MFAFLVRGGEALIERGASLCAVTSSHRYTPLMYAAQAGHAALVRRLLERGAPVDAVAKNGCAPRRVARGRFVVALSSGNIAAPPPRAANHNRRALRITRYTALHLAAFDDHVEVSSNEVAHPAPDLAAQQTQRGLSAAIRRPRGRRPRRSSTRAAAARTARPRRRDCCARAAWRASRRSTRRHPTAARPRPRSCSRAAPTRTR